MIQCEECQMWHLVYKLSAQERHTLEKALEPIYSCGAQLSEFGLDGHLGGDTACMQDITY